MEKYYIAVMDFNRVAIHMYEFWYDNNQDEDDDLSQAVEDYIDSKGHKASECQWMFHESPIEIINQ